MLFEQRIAGQTDRWKSRLKLSSPINALETCGRRTDGPTICINMIKSNALRRCVLSEGTLPAESFSSFSSNFDVNNHRHGDILWRSDRCRNVYPLSLNLLFAEMKCQSYTLTPSDILSIELYKKRSPYTYTGKLHSGGR